MVDAVEEEEGGVEFVQHFRPLLGFHLWTGGLRPAASPSGRRSSAVQPSFRPRRKSIFPTSAVGSTGNARRNDQGETCNLFHDKKFSVTPLIFAMDKS